MVMARLSEKEQMVGALIGTAIGDSVALPAEGISPRRIRKLWKGEWKHRFLFGRGMMSDDTEHHFMVVQTLLAEANDSIQFQRILARKLQLWLLGLPAGIGLATSRSLLKLWIGFPPSKSGVRSAGNGTAMRSLLIGMYFSDHPKLLAEFVKASTRITHTDPRAEIGALAIARAGAWMVQHPSGEPPSKSQAREILESVSSDSEWMTLVNRIMEAREGDLSVELFAASLCREKGVTGYVYHTVPVVLYAWLRNYGDFKKGLEAVMNCGGDTDTTAAIAGSLLGATAGVQGIPQEWLDGFVEWPRTTRVLTEAAEHLADQKKESRQLGPVSYFWPGLVLRNLLFVIVVLIHGFRRLLPPY